MNLKLLKSKDFTLLILGKLVSLIGSYMQDFALALYVLKITGSSLIFGSVITIALIPRIILSPICGVLADRFDRKKVIVYLDMLSGILIAILYIISITVGIQLIHVYVTVIVLSVISTLFQPAISAAIPSIVKKDDLVDANVFNSTVMTVGQLISPILAGFLYSIFGLPIVLLINSISFICSSISEMFISMPKLERSNKRFSFREFKSDFIEGLTFIKNESQLLKLICSALIVNIALNPVLVIGLTVVVKTVIKASDLQLGYMQTILVTGTMTGTLLVKPITKKLSLSKIFTSVLIACGVIVITMAMNTTNLYLSMFDTNLVPYISFMSLCFIMTLTVTIVNIALATLMQQIVPLEKLGRVSSITSTVAMAAIPVGQIIFSAMFEYVPTYIPLLISSTIIIGTAIQFILTSSVRVSEDIPELQLEKAEI